MSSHPAIHIAHIASGMSWSAVQTLVVVGVVGFAAALILEHVYVKHGRIQTRHLRTPIAITLALAVTAVVAPSPGFAQSTIGPMGLPDLISDPPFIWIERDLNDVDGDVIRVLSFDSFLHNVGAGALDLKGNPQIEGGVKQRVFNGEVWEDVGEPLVRFETNDGHNHFHLINAAAYSLWNEAQTERVEIGSKIGFCLLDSKQIERGVDPAYNLDEIDYCNENQPDSTDLHMGISPGWVDIYEATIQLQWVDVSNVAPGRYWVGAIIDPNDEIVESNEDNNDTVFSSNSYAVSGYVARTLPVQTGGEITLKSRVYGSAGAVAYVITDAPEHGTLSVPTGFDVLHDTISYTADPGYSGSDSFSYFAHDTNNQFPYEAEVVTVEIETDGSAAAAEQAPDTTEDVVVTAPSTAISASRYESISLPIEVATVGSDNQVRWYAKDLPAGLTIDQMSGVVEGELTAPGDTTSTIVARIDGRDFETTISWKVADRARASLRSLNDFSTPSVRRDLLVGAGTAETTYEATGLPDGLTLTSNQPSILGVSTEAGTFDVVVNELLDGEVVDTVRFTLTVRNSTKPEFVL